MGIFTLGSTSDLKEAPVWVADFQLTADTRRTMTRLNTLTEISRTQGYDYNAEGMYNPVDKPAYGAGGDRVGTVRDALVDADTGRIRYFIVDAGNWFSAKEVVVPVGTARVDDSGVYFDNMTKEQVEGMRTYVAGETYDVDTFAESDRTFRSGDYATVSTDDIVQREDHRIDYREDDRMYQSPQRLQLLEERLRVDRERYQAGSVSIGKHVETREERVNVDVKHEEVVIERHPVEGGRAVEGARLGEGSETIRVDLEAERANVTKEAYVTEEVEIGKREVTEQRTVTETVGREVLDVNEDGNLRVDRDRNLTDDEKRR